MLKKLLILTIVVLSSSSHIYAANCYSSATVNNSASLRIVDSDKALIAIPSKLSPKKNELKEVKIKNNTNEKIWVKVDNGTIDDKEEVSIEAGKQDTASIKLNDGFQGNEVVFHARWHGDNYTAEIKSFIN
jgi:hypothetical protein